MVYPGSCQHIQQEVAEPTVLKQCSLMYILSRIIKLLVTLLCFLLPKRKWRLAIRRTFGHLYLLDDIHTKFRKSLGYSLNLNTPKTFNEKIQWYKLYYCDEQFIRCADKVRVRDYFASKGVARYQVPLLGVWSHCQEIDWEVLPSRFVFKTNHGANQIWFVEDKERFDKEGFQREVTEALDCPFGEKGAQFHYGHITPCLLAEEYLEDDTGGLLDYKVYCFQGTAHYIQIDFDRFTSHTYAIYGRDWSETGCGNTTQKVPRPKTLDEMLYVAEILSKDFPHVRIDFFLVEERLYLGEMTFTTGNGLDPFSPVKWDEIFGSCWDLSRIAPHFIRKRPCLRLQDYRTIYN